MGSALTPTLVVSSGTTIRRRRDLPIAGEILVREGDTVSAEQVVARAELDGELRLVRAAELLGVPAADLAGALRVSEGARVEQGALLAELRGLWGLFRTVVTSPIGGVVEFISHATGHIGIRAPARPLTLHAYVGGTVVGIESQRAVVIEARATFVQGIFGVGGERLGVLHLLPVASTTQITEREIPESAKDLVLVGGHSPTIGALRKAADAGAVGFITGSIDDAALREYVGHDIGVALTGDESVSMTVIITEGFGALTIGARALETLQRVNGLPVSINGATQVRAGAQRPEIVAPWAANSEEDGAGDGTLSIGAPIRGIRVPYFGLRGVVRELPYELERIETGAFVRVLRAELEDGRHVTIPRANVELV